MIDSDTKERCCRFKRITTDISISVLIYMIVSTNPFSYQGVTKCDKEMVITGISFPVQYKVVLFNFI